MQAITCGANTVEGYAAAVEQRGSGSFQNKELRDAVAKHLRARNVAFKRSSFRNVQLHPEYVTDFVGTYHTGFGNTDYQRFWSVLYSIELF